MAQHNEYIERARDFDEKEWPFSSQKAWKKVISKDPSVYAYISLADQLRLTGLYTEAHKYLSLVSLEDLTENDKYFYYVNLGKVYEDQFKIDDAINCYRICIDLSNISSTAPFVLLGSLLAKQEKYIKAEKILKLGLEEEGDKDEVYYNLSTIYARQGNFAKAIKAMEECIEIDSVCNSAYEFLADFKNVVDGF